MPFVETIIIGAGPAGIQTGYFLEKLRKDYIIIERNSNAGSFFDKYPISRKLISLNKKYTGYTNPDIKLKYDWNSLLNDSGFLFPKYSDELYPDANSLVRYLSEFTREMNIRIRYNSNVVKIFKLNEENEEEKNEENYRIQLSDINYTCKYLIIATGLNKIHDRVTSSGFKSYSDIPNMSLDEFNDKRVCIVGSGNSAYELSHLLSNRSRYTIMVQKNVKLSMLTHYAGDVRGNYLYTLDLFSLKVNSAVLSSERLLDTNSFIKTNGEYSLINVADPVKKYKFDEVIFCVGFEFDDSIYDFKINRTIKRKFTSDDIDNEGNMENSVNKENSGDKGKYPEVNDKYESTNNKNMFFVGGLMHSLDHKISSGGFIHGFRYLIKFFIESIYDNYKVIKFDNIISLSKHIYQRFTNSSSLYIMQNFMCDIAYIKDGKFIYIQDLTSEIIKRLDISHLVIQLRTKKFNDLHEFFNQGKNFYTESKFLHPNITIVNYDKSLNSEIDNIINVKSEEIMFHEDSLSFFNDLKYFHGIISSVKKFVDNSNL